MITRNKVTTRIVTGILLAIIPVLVAAAAYLTRSSQASLREAYQANLGNALATAVGDQKSYLANYLTAWITNPSFQTALEAAVSYGDSASLENRATETLKTGGMHSVRVHDIAGAILVKADGKDATALDTAAPAKAVLASGKPLTLVQSAPQGILVMAFTPIELAGKRVGVVSLVNVLDRQDVERLGNAMGAEVALLRSERVLVAGSDDLAEFKADPAEIAMALATRAPHQVLDTSGAQPRFITYLPFAGLDSGDNAVCAAVFTNAASYVAASHRSLLVWLAAGALTIVLVVAVAFFVGNRIGGSIRAAIDQLDGASTQIASSSVQIGGAGKSLADGSASQAASLEETSASLEEMSSMTHRNAESAQQAKTLSNETRAAADTGAVDVEEMKRAMDDIKRSSDDVAKIIKTIDEIAFQTNILALNAAVEAARAGEAGAGFAVVAEEVRNLAHRSAHSAKETAAKIEEAIQKSERGVRISAKVGQSLGQILEKATRVDTLVAEIAQASKEQSLGISQVNGAVSEMDKVTQANAATAEETASAAEELTAQSSTLRNAIAALHHLVDAKAVAAKPLHPSQRPAAPAERRHNARFVGTTRAHSPIPNRVNGSRHLEISTHRSR